MNKIVDLFVCIVQLGVRPERWTAGAIQEVCEVIRRAKEHNHFSRRLKILVTMNVKNAFKSVRWSDMLDVLNHEFLVPKYLLQMVDDYRRDRELH